MNRQTFMKSTLCLLMALVCNVAWAQTSADGPIVTFTNVQKDGTTTFTLYINENYELAISSSSAADLGDAAKFRATLLPNGKYTYYNESKGLYMIWRGKGYGHNSDKGVLAEYNATYCDWSVNQSTNLELGYLLVSKRDNGSDGSLVIMKENGTFDAYGNTEGWHENYSNLYRIDIVEQAPRTTDFVYNVTDGAYASNGWCKSWASNDAAKPNLTISVDVNNVNGGQAGGIGLRPGKAGSATYTVTAGCTMLSLSFEAKGTDSHKISINGVEKAVGTQWKRFVIHNINAATAEFILKGDNNNDCLLRNVRFVTPALPLRAEVEGSWADNPNTHFGRVTATAGNNVTTMNLTTDHEETTHMLYGGGIHEIAFTREYRGFEFQGFFLGEENLGKSFTLTEEQEANITEQNPLVAKFTATDEVTLFYDDDEFSYRIPAIATTSTGRIIAVSDYRHNLDDVGRDNHGTGTKRIDLVARTSDNNGQTWSDIITIAQGDNSKTTYDRAFGDAAIAAVGENIVVMAAAGGDATYGGSSAEKHIRMARIFSSDNGATWSNEEITSKMIIEETSLIPNAVAAFFGSGKLAVDPNFNNTQTARIYGALLVKIGGNAYNNFVVYSDDLGQNWAILGGSQTPVGSGDEPKVEILPSGQILLSARRGGGRQFNVFTYTDKATNAGTWDTAKNGCDNGGSNGTNGEIICLDAINEKGEAVKLLLQSQPKGGSDQYDRKDVTIWYKELSADATYTTDDIKGGWTQGLQVSTQKSAYSAMTLQQDGKIGFSFEEAPCYGDDHTKGYSMVYIPLTIEAVTEGQCLTYSEVNLQKMSLKYLISSTQALVDECYNYYAAEAPLTTTAGSNYYVSTNAQEDAEGPITNLVDGSVENHFHSEYKTDMGGTHYIQIDLGSGNETSSFRFKYATRKAETDFPKTIEIHGSTDGTTYELIETVTNLPVGNTSETKYYESPIIEAEKSYAYLRFMVTANNSGKKEAGGHPYFHMAEFDLMPRSAEPTCTYPNSVLVPAAVENAKTAIEAAKIVAEEEHTAEEYATAASALQAKYDELAAAIASGDLPVLLSLNADKPYVYKIGIKRGDTKVLQFDYTGKPQMVAVADYDADNMNQGWYFTKGSADGKVFIHPYLAGGDVLSAKNTDNAHSAVWAAVKGAETHQEWTIPVVNKENGTYNIKAGDGSNYFSNNGGVSNKMGFWSNENTTDGGSLFIFERVEFDGELWKNTLNAYVQNFCTRESYVDGNTLGCYQNGAAYNEARAEAVTLLGDEAAAESNLKEAYIALRGANESVMFIAPKPGQFFRIQGISGYYIDATSIHGNDKATTGQMSMKSAEECNYNGTIFYLDEQNHLLNYATGTYAKQTREIGAVGDTDKGVWTFEESPRYGGKFALRCTVGGTGNGQHLHDSDGNRADRCGRNCGDRHDFTLEEVTELPFTISKVGYGTLYAPVALQIPDGVEAYTGVVSGNYLDLNPVTTGTIPANTGVVLKAAENTYNFKIVADVERITSHLVGSIAAKANDKKDDEEIPYYTLQKPEGYENVVFMQYNGDVLAGSKAYLDFTANPTSAKSISIRFEGTTEIDNSQLTINNSQFIYDLQGRRVLNPTKGIYIVNGKKVVIK